MERNVKVYATISKWRNMYQHLVMSVPTLINDSRTDFNLIVNAFPRMWECLGVDNVRVQEVAAFEGAALDSITGLTEPYLTLDRAILGSGAAEHGFKDLGWKYDINAARELRIEPSGLPPSILSVNKTFTIMFDVARNYYPTSFTVYTGTSYTGMTQRMVVTCDSSIESFVINSAPSTDTHIKLVFSNLYGNADEGFFTDRHLFQILRFYTGEVKYVHDDLVELDIENKATVNLTLPISEGSITVQNVVNSYSNVVKGDRVSVFYEHLGVTDLIGIYYVKSISDKVFSLEQKFVLVDANEYLNRSALLAETSDATRRSLRDQSYACSTYRTDKMALLSPTDTSINTFDTPNIDGVVGYTTNQIYAKTTQDIENNDLMAFTALMLDDKMISFTSVQGRNLDEFAYEKPKAMSYSGFGVFDINSITGTSHEVIDAVRITNIRVKYVQPPAWVKVRKYPNNHAGDYKTYVDTAVSIAGGESEVFVDCQIVHNTGTDYLTGNLAQLYQLDYEVEFEYFTTTKTVHPFDLIKLTVLDKRTDTDVTIKGYVTAVQHSFKNGYAVQVALKGVKV